MRLLKKIFLLGTIIAGALVLQTTNIARAATMSFISSASTAVIGNTIDVSVRVNGEGQTVNAAQATIQYPAGILQVVRVDHSNSIFNIWAQEPTVNTSTGEISFLGGGTNSFTGSSLYILDVTFMVRGAGAATLSFANAGVTAGDGTGANILSGTTPLSINTGGTLGAAAVPASSTSAAVEMASSSLLAPVTRAAATATGLPMAPTLSVPLYPDQSRWYNLLGDTIVLWNVPPDITHVAASVSHVENAVVGTPEAALANGKDLGILGDGIWYAKVQFENGVGWGAPAYYKISVDTTPPLPFAISIENAGTDNPSPTVQFETNDSLSGIANYTIAVDGTVIATTTATTLALPPQAPGAHTLVVSASDLAGNSSQDSASFAILPLPTPQITFVEPSIAQGSFVFASGNSAPSSSIEVIIIDGGNRQVFDGIVAADSDGHWDITANVPLAIGTYSLSAIARDARGAKSLATAARPFMVLAPSVISFGAINLGWFEILLITILLAITIASLCSWWYVLKQQRRGRYNIVTGRDIEKLSDLLSADIKDLSGLPAVKNIASDPEFIHAIATLNENVAKIKKYLKQELEKLK